MLKMLHLTKPEFKTRGYVSSERRACYHAFYAAFAMAMFGVAMGVTNYTGYAVLVTAVVSPLAILYNGGRVATKWKEGEFNPVKD